MRGTGGTRQGLKPDIDLIGFIGMTEVMPFQNLTFHHGLLGNWDIENTKADRGAGRPSCFLG